MTWREDSVSAAPAGSEVEGTAEWQADSVPSSSISERLGALTRSASGALIENAPLLAGAGGGAYMGAQIGALGGPFAPVTIPAGAFIGTLAGGYSGLKTGEELRRQAAKTPMANIGPESEPEEVRPFAYSGEVIGGSFPFAAAPYAFVRKAPEVGGKIVRGILETARDKPKAFVLAEGGATSGAALGSGISEEVFPGEMGPRIAAEIGGGFLHPARIIAQGGSLGLEGFKRFVKSRTEEGKKDAASEIIKSIVNNAGEDTGALVRMLKESGLVDVTPGMKTGSPILQAFERKLANENGKFGAEYQKMADDGLEQLRVLSETLSATGDPQALKLAAELRAHRFETLLTARLRQAEQDAVQARGRVSGDRPSQAGEVSSDAYDSIRTALGEGRSVENSLWAKVPKDTFVPMNNTMQAYDNIRANMLPEETLPKVVEGFISRMRDDNRSHESIGDLLKLRSRMLELQRDAAGKREFGEARSYGQIAQGMLTDIMSLPEATPSVAEARSFSRALNDVFTRSFGGKALGRTGEGEQRIAPELLLDRAFGSGGTGGALRLGELEEGAYLTQRMGREGGTGPAMTSAQDRFIRMMAAESIDPSSGRVNPARMERFVTENGALLERFPNIRNDLRTASGTERVFREVEKANKIAQKAVNERAAFSQLLGVEDSSRAIEYALRSDAPIANMQAIARLAQASGPAAVDGFRSATLQHAARQATSGNGEFSFYRYGESLLRPTTPGGKSPMDVLRESGSMTPEQFERYQQIIGEAAKIEGALKSGVKLDEILSTPDALYDLVLRIAGSNLAGLGVAAQSSPLIAGAAGSKTMRQIFDKVPQGKIQDVLIEAARSPKFMAELLERPTSERARLQLAKQINGFLWNAGLVGGEPEQDRQKRIISFKPAPAPMPAQSSIAPTHQFASVVPNVRRPGRPNKIDPNALGLGEALDDILGTNDSYAEIAAS